MNRRNTCKCMATSEAWQMWCVAYNASFTRLESRSKQVCLGCTGEVPDIIDTPTSQGSEAFQPPPAQCERAVGGTVRFP